ncbi:MAG: Tex family protein [Granulosicoccus sp.]
MSATALSSISARIAQTINASERQVNAAIDLLDGGATVPFISRYRKEVTGALTDAQLRDLEERLVYLRELEQRRVSIIEAIEQQGKLSDELKNRLAQVQTKAELEDLYLPFKKKRRTKGQIAIEAGLQPLAERLWDSPENDPEALAQGFIITEESLDKALQVADTKAALEGARYILMERFAEDASLIARLRALLKEQAYLCSSLVKDKAAAGEKFADYFDHQEPLSRVPGHRALAMFRGRSEGFLSLQLLLKEGNEFSDARCIDTVGSHLGFENQSLAADAWRAQVVSWTWKIKISLHLESELFAELRTRADSEAIGVFASNLKDLLLAAPAGARATLGLDPGYRSGVKVTVIDPNGKVLDFDTIYPHKPQQQWQPSLGVLSALCTKHKVELVAVGNGTASRETEKLADELIRLVAAKPADQQCHVTKVVVSEAGASVYSASKVAEDEFPDLDVTIRGAVSIARRLQDPLAELVKIDPKAIGVGQYQHDVSQSALARSLDATVEDCVNSVGVDLGTASAALLTRVAGLTPALAENIVEYRDTQGMFKTRKELKKVPRLGPKAFEQAAGFLRIRDGRDPLDCSGVHPESYPVVKRIIEKAQCSIDELIGDSSRLRAINAEEFVDEQFGVLTIKDILSELEKPGRDPRPEFKAVRFADGVEKITDLVPDQVLEGKVTNVTAFGAFVDVGVHQDGLVHISALSDTFVKDPREVVKAGNIVKVKVMSVDVQRQRIALSMRMSDSAADGEQNRGLRDRPSGSGGGQQRSTVSGSSSNRNIHNNSGNGKASAPSRGNRASNMTSGADQPSALAMQLKAALEAKK